MGKVRNLMKITKKFAFLSQALLATVKSFEIIDKTVKRSTINLLEDWLTEGLLSKKFIIQETLQSKDPAPKLLKTY